MKIIDCDSHFIPPTVFDNVSEQYKELIPKYEFDSNQKITKFICKSDAVKINYNRMAPINKHCVLPGISSIKHRLEYLDSLGIDKQLLGPQEYTMRFNTSVEPNLAAEMAHSFNIEIKKIVDSYPNRFFSVAMVAVQNMKLALKEIDWVIENNFKAIYIDIIYLDEYDKGCRPLSTIKDIDLLFEKCEKNNIIIFAHTAMHHAKVSKKYSLQYKSIHKNDTLIDKELLIYDLIVSGLLDRFPKIKIVIAEVYDYLIINCYKNLKNQFKNDPLHYFKNNLFIAVDVEKTETLKYMVDEFGSDRLLFCTDYPHEDPFGSNKFNDVKDLKKSILPIKDLENIAYKNAEKLFGL
jgi:predicted TIM-barrel fold metal-dependent hydrolase